MSVRESEFLSADDADDADPERKRKAFFDSEPVFAFPHSPFSIHHSPFSEF
jgi:hypothetical protein